ncbi:MAG: hypothetical protein F9K18_13475 [Thermoanaerobaculia bacterium]|nr:MAG: hypothetical protein F9K18_13475 [Thermoanaerobaculia bacterium]
MRHARARYLSDGQVSLFLDYYTSSNCSAGGLGFHTATFPPSPAVWADATIDVTTMANAHGVKLRLNAIDPAPHSLKVDAAFLGRFEPIFRDGFDGNTMGETQPCRWSAP